MKVAVMSLDGKQVYEFGDFRVDGLQKKLLRNALPVPLTPKAFDTLEILIANAGRLVEKDKLIRQIWPDCFVEESNLTSNIKTLRKALGDDAAHPRFIETVPRRGYRFIAEVRKDVAEYHPEVRRSDSLGSESRVFGTSGLQLAAAGLVILLVGFAGIWYARNKSIDSEIPLLANNFSSEKLTTNGMVLQSVVSADGRFVVYTNGIDGKQSVWLRHVDNGSNTQIIPPSSDMYDGLELSMDGETLFFARRPQLRGEVGAIYRLPILGGVPQKIAENTVGTMSVSADGKRFSFVRYSGLEDEFYSLWIADAADGKNERKVVSRVRPHRIGDNQISADGKTITFAVGQSQNASNEFNLSEVNIETGVETKFSEESFFNIRSIVTLPDGSGLLITASRIPNKLFGIWHVSRSTGQAVLLTRNAENYHSLSLDAEARTLVATQVRQAFRLQVFNGDVQATSRNITDASHVAFAPDGRLLYSSLLTGNDEIWSMNTDGTGQRQLTNSSSDNGWPLSSPDNKFIFFASNRSGAAQVWRMNADGSDQVQVTRVAGGTPLHISSDGEWLIFHHALDKTLWRVAAKGGDERSLLGKRAHGFAISPDGSQAAFINDDTRSIEIVSLPDGRPMNTFQSHGERPIVHLIKWTPDGSAIAFISVETDEYFAFRLQPIDGSSQRKIADLGSERISSLSVASDGRTFAVTQGGWQHDAVLLKGLR